MSNDKAVIDNAWLVELLKNDRHNKVELAGAKWFSLFGFDEKPLKSSISAHIDDEQGLRMLEVFKNDEGKFVWSGTLRVKGFEDFYVRTRGRDFESLEDAVTAATEWIPESTEVNNHTWWRDSNTCWVSRIENDVLTVYDHNDYFGHRWERQIEKAKELAEFFQSRGGTAGGGMPTLEDAMSAAVMAVEKLESLISSYQFSDAYERGKRDGREELKSEIAKL